MGGGSIPVEGGKYAGRKAGKRFGVAGYYIVKTIG
jgi:hypothetical protein